MSEVLHLACAVEGRYVPHAATMLHSVLAHRGDLDVRVTYLHGRDLSRKPAGLLAAMVERMGGSIDFVEIPDERIAGLPVKGFTGKATWYRIFLPELLPDVDRILYLDADAVVADGLPPLWSTDLGDSYVAAVTNVFERHYAHRPAEIGLDGEAAYFNAGVLLFNLDAMRRDGCSDALLTHGRSHARSLTWRDQDALNAVLAPRRLRLHPRWNCMNSILIFPWAEDLFGADAVQEARERPGIRHFEGPGLNKPWHFLAGEEARDLYMRHRRETPWPRLRRTGVTPANVVRRLAR